MNLNTYLNRPGSLTVAELRARMTSVKSDAQIRQWQHGYGGRVPSPANCVELERITDGLIRRWDLRPSDWHLIWPELIGSPGAPSIKGKPTVSRRSRTTAKAEPAPTAFVEKRRVIKPDTSEVERIQHQTIERLALNQYGERRKDKEK